MSDENPDRSGSRWEPTDAPASTPASTQVPAAQEHEMPVEAASAGRSSPSRTRAGVAAGAAAALVAVGLGGFAVGRATGDDRDGGPGIHQVGFQPGDDGDGDGDGRGFDDGDGDHGFPPQGGLPPGAPDGTTPDTTSGSSDS